jgi:hypothetical protein
MDLRQTIELAAGRAPWRTAEESMQGGGAAGPGRTSRTVSNQSTRNGGADKGGWNVH